MFIKDSEIVRFRVSHAILSVAATSLFISPIYFWRALFFGIAWGDMMFFRRNGYFVPDGLTVPVQGLTEEERIAIK
jgi:hypothetical protein